MGFNLNENYFYSVIKNLSSLEMFLLKADNIHDVAEPLHVSSMIKELAINVKEKKGFL